MMKSLTERPYISAASRTTASTPVVARASMRAERVLRLTMEISSGSM